MNHLEETYYDSDDIMDEGEETSYMSVYSPIIEQIEAPLAFYALRDLTQGIRINSYVTVEEAPRCTL